jgi:hypothetical protein
VNQQSELKFYVSDKGRIFSRFERHAGQNHSNLLDQVSGAADDYLKWKFEDGRLISDQASLRRT